MAASRVFIADVINRRPGVNWHCCINNSFEINRLRPIQRRFPPDSARTQGVTRCKLLISKNFFQLIYVVTPFKGNKELIAICPEAMNIILVGMRVEMVVKVLCSVFKIISL